jgi:hypothetical protein
MKKPKSLLVVPPVYDFALYDHFLKPYGLLRLASWLNHHYEIEIVNGLDYRDPETGKIYPDVTRKADGTGKYPRFPQPLPEPIKNTGKKIERRFARYGLPREAFTGQLLKVMKRAKPDIVFLATGMTYWYSGVEEAAETIKKFFPGIPLVTGGVYASLLPEHCKSITGSDLVFRNDLDEIKSLLKKCNLPVPEGEFPRNPLITSMFRDAAVLRLNSGCPYCCDYCASRQLESSFKAGDPAAAYRHLKKIRNQFGTNNFAFYDDALLVSKENVLLPFLDQVITDDQLYDVSFYLPNALHIALLDLKTAKLMKQAGFKEIRLGFESASVSFHELRDKKYLPEQFRQGIRLLKNAGFAPERIRVYILAGLPGQYAEEVAESVHFAKKFNVSISLAEYSPVPGTAMWDDAVRLSDYPLESEPLFHNNTFFPMEWPGFTRNNLKKLKDTVHNR